MVIKDKFRLVTNAPNILNLSSSIINANSIEENNPRHVFAVLELKKKSINHFTSKKIFNLIGDVNRRDSIQVVRLDEYPLHVSYNRPTKGLLINLKLFDIDEVSNMNPNDLYASLTYAYAFSLLVNKKFKISEAYAKPIIDYMLSFYIQVFGKEYGLVGIYASGIPKLKFLIACYILSSYFGYPTNKNLFNKVSSLAPYSYSEEYGDLLRYDFSKVEDFIKALSELKVMPGLSVTKFTSKLYRFFGINILPAIEDCSRFFCTILTSSISGNSMVPKFLFKYNESKYHTLIDITRRMF
jgi:hypothetical protein